MSCGGHYVTPYLVLFCYIGELQPLEEVESCRNISTVAPGQRSFFTKKNFASLDTLLAHVFRWAGTYLTWICEQLDLPDPDLRPVPDPRDLDAQAEKYADHILLAWQSPLYDIPAKRFFRETFLSPWGVPYCVDAMLEHAVMHPFKHRFQLEELMGDKRANRDSGGHS